ncbi:hypothetical protein P5D95_25635 [Vibrio parahaemolyticus]|nr:hypothetical protein [Vibrio parahaemolyticus]
MVFTYKTAKENLPELMGELAESASKPKFVSNVTNEKIDMFKRIVGDDVYIVLDIYYHSREDYEIRTDFECIMVEWNDIWFTPNNKHEEVRVGVFDVL